MRPVEVALVHRPFFQVTPSMNHCFPPKDDASSRIHPLSQYSSTRDDRLGRRQLPADFVPDSTSVICGRGKACTASPGNKRLRTIVESFISKYSEATTKTEKTNTVNLIMDAVQGKDREKGMFVRQHDGWWWEVEDAVAREKVGCLIRDCLHTQYRSSSKAKFLKKKRRSQMVASMKKSDASLSLIQEADFCGSIAIGANLSAMPSFLHGGLFSLNGMRQENTSSISSIHKSSHLFPKQTKQIHQVFNDENSIAVPGVTDNAYSIEIRSRNMASSTMEQDIPITAFPSGLDTDPTIQDTLAVITMTHSHLDSVRDVLAGIGKGTNILEDDGSPESTSWGIQGRGRGFLQQARDVISNNGNSDSLPDDLSGIFDD